MLIFLPLFICLLQSQPTRSLATISIPSESTTLTSKISFSEVFIDHEREGANVGERVKFGESVVELKDLATPEECRWLVNTCLKAAEAATPTRQLDKPGLVRLPTIAAAERATVTNTPCADPLPKDVDEILKMILTRAAAFIDEELPSLTSTLFETDSLENLLTDNHLKFSSREPAVNRYTKGGEFLAHKDAQALTVLLPLSCPENDFTGGGTAFWGQDSRGHRVEDPSSVLKPPAGTAMLFGGCVTHAGVAVDSGSRIVFVASFSPQNHAIQTEQRDIYGDSM